MRFPPVKIPQQPYITPLCAMVSILTLVHTGGLDPALADTAVRTIETLGGSVGEVKHHACAIDITFHGPCPGLPEAAATWAADFAIQPLAFRQKKLLISDMEMTLVQNEFLDDIAELAGVGEEVKQITALAMNGQIDFAGSLKARLALLKGQPVSLLEQAWQGMKLMPGAEMLFSTLRSHGVRTIIVSGGFTFFVDRVRAILQADAAIANQLEISGDTLTGNPVEPILGKETKQRILEEEAAALGIDLQETLAAGDGANDLPMLLRAGLGVAYHAKPSVATAARCRIRYSDLTALLAFAGIHQK